jgi:predicted Rossmann-fold nucleotide-binding protein
VGLLNAGGYYDGLLQFLGQTVQAGFVGTWQMDLLHTGTDAAVLLPQLVQAGGFGTASGLRQRI